MVDSVKGRTVPEVSQCSVHSVHNLLIHSVWVFDSIAQNALCCGALWGIRLLLLLLLLLVCALPTTLLNRRQTQFFVGLFPLKGGLPSADR